MTSLCESNHNEKYWLGKTIAAASSTSCLCDCDIFAHTPTFSCWFKHELLESHTTNTHITNAMHTPVLHRCTLHHPILTTQTHRTCGNSVNHSTSNVVKSLHFACYLWHNTNVVEHHLSQTHVFVAFALIVGSVLSNSNLVLNCQNCTS